ncbi:MAG: hypothetical protein P1P89_19860 [Desulfobacterales bacterium]|nr:hypothetical protein [Desulfobacterales bacterium]
MPEKIIITILLLICLGQVWAIFHGRLTAAIYYCSVAPLGYFSVWKFGTWSPDLLCGLLLIVAGLLVFRRTPGIPRFGRHRLVFFLVFLILNTLVGSVLWPIGSMAGKSAVYGQLRGVGQILNWLIIIGAAWQIGIAFSQTGGFEKARKVIIGVGVLHSVYALYQVIAFYLSLPMTGIRRPYSGIVADVMNEHFAAFQMGGATIYRASSLIGEPKGLGVISLVWIAALLTLLMEGKTRHRSRTTWALFLSLVVMFLTYSTSAWIGFVGMMAIALWTLRNRFASRLARLLLLLALLIGGLAIVNFSGVLPKTPGGIISIVQERTTGREYLRDMPEIEAIQVLAEHPWMILSGTGLGGMSFYIARNLGGSDIILFPNTGLLAYISDMGLIGITLLIFSLRGGLRPTLTPSTQSDEITRSLSFIGTVCLMQTFIFSAGILMFGLAFLLAAEFRRCSLRSVRAAALWPRKEYQ